MKKQIIYIMATVLSMSVHCYAQGSLSPAGSPAPTMKTLDQIEPRIDVATLPSRHITEPGSYYLSSNVEESLNGVVISATNVTLDLNGFEIRSTTGAGSGVFISSGMSGITVRNGAVRDFYYGVNCELPDKATGCLFENLEVSGCGNHGIYAGDVTRIIDCRVHDGPGNGIYAADHSFLSGCLVDEMKGDWGILVEEGCILENCVVSGCDSVNGYAIAAANGAGLRNCTAYTNETKYAIFTGEGSVLDGCQAVSNVGQYGIYAYEGSALRNCILKNHQGAYSMYIRSGSILRDCIVENVDGTYGIYALSGVNLESCVVKNNSVDYGIHGSSYVILKGCSLLNNEGSGASSYGIQISEGMIMDCIVSNNRHTNSVTTASQGIGIDAVNAATIENCEITYNTGDGIRTKSDSLISGNRCYWNGGLGVGAGIHVTESDNRIEGNTVTDNDRGIQVDAGGNLIIRNSASGNGTNFVISASNKVGVIVAAPDSGAINGDSGGAGLGFVDAWSNISF